MQRQRDAMKSRAAARQQPLARACQQQLPTQFPFHGGGSLARINGSPGSPLGSGGLSMLFDSPFSCC